MKNIAIILSGGTGTRIGGAVPKQFLKINNKEILTYSLLTFYSCNFIDEIILVYNKDFKNLHSELIEKNKLSDKVILVEGGKNRQDSVNNAIEYLSKKEDDAIVLVHDSARPFVSEEIIIKNIEAVKKSLCCTTAIKSSNSIYLTKESKFVKEVNRDSIYIAQTPQSAYLRIFKKAFEKVDKIYTDEAALFSMLGYVPHIVEGEEKNKKITYPEDLEN